MRIRYTYQDYPSCPRATEHSRAVESGAAYLNLLIAPINLIAIITFFMYTSSFFGAYNWGEFLGGIAFATVVALIDCFAFIIRPNNTQCTINIILAEDGNYNLPSYVVKQFCKNLRKENRKVNAKAFIRFFAIFLVGLSSAVALVATLKGIYFLNNKEGGLPLVLGGILAIGVFACLFWRLLRKPPKETRKEHSCNNKKLSPKTYVPSKSEESEFCRKCGTRLYADSEFCHKCGTKMIKRETSTSQPT